MRLCITEKELQGDLDFYYDIKKIQSTIEFYHLLARDTQLAFYRSTVLLLGDGIGGKREVQFQFSNMVMNCKLTVTADGMNIDIIDIYLPVTIFDIDTCRVDDKSWGIPCIASNLYIKSVEGYKFKNTALPPIFINTEINLTMDKDCLRGVHLDAPLEHTGFETMSEYMRNCSIHKIYGINFRGIGKFKRAGNKVAKIVNLYTDKEFHTGELYGIVSGEEISKYLTRIGRSLNGIEVHNLQLRLYMRNIHTEYLDRQMSEFVSAFLKMKASVKELYITINGGFVGTCEIRLVKVDSENVIIC